MDDAKSSASSWSSESSLDEGRSESSGHPKVEEGQPLAHCA